MADNSHIRLGKRVKKSKAHPFGWEYMAQSRPMNHVSSPCPGLTPTTPKKPTASPK